MNSRVLLQCFQFVLVYVLITVYVDAHNQPFRRSRHGTSLSRQKRLTDIGQSCTVSRRGGSVRCKVPAGGEVRFSALESWIQLRRRKPRKLKVICEQGGVFVGAWPLKAENLRKVFIKGCVLRGWFSQQFNKQLDNEPDFLRDVRIIDSQIETDILEVINLTLGMLNSSKSVFCGPQTVRTEVFRNITHIFRHVPNQQEILINSGILNTVPDHFQNLEDTSPYTCFYNDLEYLDESIKKSRSKFSFNLLVASARFPKLKWYNISSNILPKIPQKLNSWWHVFPSLEYLDLSNNKIENVTIEPYSNPQPRTTPLVVDLRRNRIKTFPMELSGAARMTPAIIFDLRENPLVCDCKIKHLQDYLTSLPSTYSHRGVVCQDPINFRGLSVQSPAVRDFLKSSC